MAAVDLEGTADWSEGRIFTVEALSAFAAASGGLTREADASDIRDSDSERSAALSPLSLEQIISSNLVPEIWTVLVKESSKAVESQGEDIAFMELQGVSYVWRTDQFLDWGLPDTRSHLKKNEVKLLNSQAVKIQGNFRHDIRIERPAA